MSDLIARALASNDPDAESIVRACVAHAHYLLSLRPSPLETRERALRKAGRAARIVHDLGASDALLLAATRAHVDAMRAIPGRLQEALDKAQVLLAMLERSPDDTRQERAARWHDRGAMTVPWGGDDKRRRWTREDCATSEAALQRSVALFVELGDERQIVEVIGALLDVRLACGAILAIDELPRGLPRSIAPALRARAQALRDRIPRADSAHKRTSLLCKLADALEALKEEQVSGAHPPNQMVVGDRVRHASFGLGDVVAALGDKVDVRFDDGTTRRLVERVLHRVFDEQSPKPR